MWIFAPACQDNFFGTFKRWQWPWRCPVSILNPVVHKFRLPGEDTIRLHSNPALWRARICRRCQNVRHSNNLDSPPERVPNFFFQSHSSFTTLTWNVLKTDILMADLCCHLRINASLTQNTDMASVARAPAARPPASQSLLINSDSKLRDVLSGNSQVWKTCLETWKKCIPQTLIIRPIY